MQLAGDLRRAGFQALDSEGQVIDGCLIEGKAVNVGLPGVTRDADGFRQVRQGQGFFAQGFDEVFEHGDYSESRARRKLGLPTFTVRAGMNCSRRALAQAENLVSETR